jgi:predicted RNA binding protein YcfA (HicA-like mRNA interferase family)
MKLPHDVPAERLIRSLEAVGYVVLRQGSDVKLRTKAPTHTITVPLHNPLKTGTLRGILTEVALMRSITVDSLVARL